MDLLLAVDSATGAPLHRQVYEGIRRAILTGRLRPGDRLPATRSLAEQLSLSRQTVAEAYDQLQAEGYVQGRRGSGTYVAPNVPEEPLLSRSTTSPSTGGASAARLSAWGRRVVAAGPWPPDRDLTARIDLRPHRVAQDVFPWETWSSAVERALRARETFLGNLPPAGHPALRDAIASHVDRFRAVACDPESVVVVNGSQQGLNLLAQLLLEPGDRVAVEDPGYPSARLAFEARSLDVTHVPVDAEGMVVERLDGGQAAHRLIHVTPSHQDPTGATLSVSRRLALLEIARRQGAIVVEDDYDSEFRYEGRPIESLQGLDSGSNVVYAGTFSKSVLPGLRIGYMILPPSLAAAFVAAKTQWDHGTPILEQAALAELMRSGDYERHIRRMRRLYRTRRDALLAALIRHFGDRVDVGPRHGGLNLLVELDAPGTSEEIATRALACGLAVRPATQYYSRPPARPTFLLGFGGCDEAQIEEGIAILARAAVER